MGRRAISIGYLGLTPPRTPRRRAPGWRRLVRILPLGGSRPGRRLIGGRSRPNLRRLGGAAKRRREAQRWRRAAITFGLEAALERGVVLQRYELLYEADSIPEADRETRRRRRAIRGRSMIGDHRRILATGIARLRAKIKYRPVVFELMPATFTLLQLQRCVEALAGLQRSQTELPPADRTTGAGRGDRRDRQPNRRAAGQAVPFPPAVLTERASLARSCRSPGLDKLILRISISRYTHVSISHDAFS